MSDQLLNWAGDNPEERELLAFCRDHDLLDDYQAAANRRVKNRDWDNSPEVRKFTRPSSQEADAELEVFLQRRR